MFFVGGLRGKRQGLAVARLPGARFCSADQSLPALVGDTDMGEEMRHRRGRRVRGPCVADVYIGLDRVPKRGKGSHRNLIANTGSIVSALKLTAQDRICAILPFDYCFGASLLHTHLPRWRQRSQSSSVFLEDILDDMQTHRCTGLAAVPTVWQRLIRESTFRNRAWPHLRYLQQAHGRMPDPYLREYLKWRSQIISAST